ncbi:hypothetical protein CANCADRAFT_18035, partial [Tortispora caseinolytica NRRL Y-17796]
IESIRKSQRTPQTCSNCGKRKIKCDKQIPCLQCIKRGKAVTCRREIVRVQDQLRNLEDFSNISVSSIDDIDMARFLLSRVLTENAELRKILTTNNPQSKTVPVQFRGVSSLFSEEPKKPKADLPRLSRAQSEEIIRFCLIRFLWFHNAVHPPTFLHQHDEFFDYLERRSGAGDSYLLSPIDTYDSQPDTINWSRRSYLWLSVYYALLSSGIYFMDEAQVLAVLGLGASEESISEKLSENYFQAAQVCLFRGEFMKVPDIYSVQAIAVMTLICQNFGGFDLMYCLLNAAVFIAQKLNLHRISPEYGDKPLSDAKFLDRELGRRLWYTLVVSDWMSNLQRYPAIGINSFSTTPPGNYNDHDLFECKGRFPDYPPDVVTSTTYILFMIRISSIRRTSFDSDWIKSKATMISRLQQADKDLVQIMRSLPPTFCTNEKDPTGMNVLIRSLQEYIISLELPAERLSLHMILARYLSRDQWIKTSRPICLESIKAFMAQRRRDKPLMFEKIWVVESRTVAVGVFLVLDIL